MVAGKLAGHTWRPGKPTDDRFAVSVLHYPSTEVSSEGFRLTELSLSALESLMLQHGPIRNQVFEACGTTLKWVRHQQASLPDYEVSAPILEMLGKCLLLY